MKKCNLIAVVVLFFAFGAFSVQAQDNTQNPWKKGVAGSISFNQVSFVNWASGGDNSLSGEAFFGVFANYKKDKCSWDNSLNIAYGIIKLGKNELQKSNDKVELESKFGYAASAFWNYTAYYSFKTQFYEGFDYSKKPKTFMSNFMAPAYTIFSLGMDYNPNETFSLFLSPITSKTTIVLDKTLSQQGAFGVKAGENKLMEYGAFLRAKLKMPIVTNVVLESSLDLFSSYNNNPQYIDVNWEMLIDMKINKYLSANLRTNLIFDEDIKIADKDGVMKSRIQFKEAFGVGISYRIPEL